jgi:hypothetical protein
MVRAFTSGVGEGVVGVGEGEVGDGVVGEGDGAAQLENIAVVKRRETKTRVTFHFPFICPLTPFFCSAK